MRRHSAGCSSFSVSARLQIAASGVILVLVLLFLRMQSDGRQKFQAYSELGAASTGPAIAADATLAAAEELRITVATEDWSLPVPGSPAWGPCILAVACVSDAGENGATTVSDCEAKHPGAPLLGGDGSTAAAAILAWPALGGATSPSGRRNAAYAAAVAARSCAVWDAASGVHLTLADDLPAAAATALSPLPAPATAPVYMGVRPRRAARSGGWGDLVNPLSVLAPTEYQWPRGYPTSQGEAERNGFGAGTPELVRLAAGSISADDIVVLQSPLAGAADSLCGAEAGAVGVAYRGRLPAVLLAPGAVAPIGATSAFVRERGLWSLFLPPSLSPELADIWRGFIAQAIFHLCGLHVAWVPTWASRDVIPPPSMASVGDEGTSQLLAILGEWVDERSAACAAYTPAVTSLACNSAALMEDVYIILRTRGLVTADDVRAVQAWLLALRSLGYAFPSSFAAAPDARSGGLGGGGGSILVLSPPRPPALDDMNVHVAVHVNWARDNAELAVPLWHAIYAAQYASVSYHLDASGQGAGYVPATFFASLASAVVPPKDAPAPQPGWPSGYFAYEAFLTLWTDASSPAAHAGAVLWMHDDIFADPGVVAAWLRLDGGAPQQCVVIMDSAGDSELLPPISAWSSGNWWLPRLAGEGAAVIAAGVPCAARGGAPLSDGELWKGYSDAFAARRGCSGADAFAATLARLRAAGAFLEIAVHSAANCAEANADLGKWREFSLWTERRADPFAYLEASHAADAPPILHPLKPSDILSVAVMVELRDDAFRREWADEPRTGG